MAHKPEPHVDELITRLERAAAQGGAALRDAVAAALSQALHGPAPGMAGVGEVLGALMHAVGAAAERKPGLDTDRLVDEAMAGTDKTIAAALAARAAHAAHAAQAAPAASRAKPVRPSAPDLVAQVAQFEAAVMGLVQQAAAEPPALRGDETVQVTLQNMQTAFVHSRTARLRAGPAMSEAESAAAGELVGGMAAALRGASARRAAKGLS
jgi:hypothetical protein